ncbi:Starch-binding associating with outer membrane [Hyunsoonleella jejuensis]|uniref:Starch-binding associating with outer membrane n=1 Tax=Hyunsoonleella jejuensis TaxID=419940 RepID=A0A1H9INR4_9FLAO|nr:RagB/SusD family nutrient uptake outer membrane protein [Hyunsoonleella jejuensis]SEQ76169.1 Starch-binding associating with outer membrane [Hyunsoonleella jejuensis]
MKNFKVKIVLFLGLLLAFACEDYLDIAPEAEIEAADVFGTFETSQGFVEEMYNLVVDYGTNGWSFQDYIYGDDGYNTQGFKFSTQLDRGELNRWIGNSLSYLHQNNRFQTGSNNGTLGSTNEEQGRGRPKVWNASMRGIRKANVVIANEDLMVGLTQDEKDVILGQAYFFRAFFHNEVMKFWGRFPHIQEVFTGVIDIPRPETYKEVALSINEDYKKAIELLPVDWDDEPYGQRTRGNNAGRLTKGAAYGFQGKNLLFAASPLMFFNNQPGINTYTYDTELAAMAVDAFAEVLKLEQAGEYSLATNMEDYKKVLWETPTNTWPGLVPEARELIFAGSAGSHVGSTLSFMATGMPRPIAATGTQCTSATHNYIHQNFGMANGLSIEDDLSGVYGTPTYNPNRPFDNRDPRFYAWVFKDRDTLSTRGGVPAVNRTMKLYSTDENGNSGAHRDRNNYSWSGYMFKKFYPEIDGQYHSQRGNNILRRFTGIRMHMRLTDVYLMYAEALHVSRGATTAPSSFSLTAEQAINILRARAGIANVNPAIVADSNKFLDEIRRERAVELSYEGHRWVDIRRWGVAHEDKYRIKTKLNFDKDWTFFEEDVLVDRVCEYPKHYWLPFEANQTQFYEGFPQNPGW